MENMSTKRKPVVLSIKDKQIIISLLDEAADLWHTEEQRQDPKIYWQHRDKRKIKMKVPEAGR